MKTLRILLLAVAVLSLHSCDNITEEIHLNEDGSGECKFYSDMIPSIRLMATQFSGILGDSTEVDTVQNEDIEAYIWKDFPEGNIDSSFSYLELADSAENATLTPEKRKLMERIVGFMEGGKEKGYMNMGAKFSFRDLQDLQTLSEALQDNQKNETEMPGGDALNELQTDTRYSLKEGVFARKTKFISKPKVNGEELEAYQMMFGGKMKTIVHLPKKVVSAKGENISLKEDRKVTLEYSMLDYILGKTSGDFEIVMEK